MRIIRIPFLLFTISLGFFSCSKDVLEPMAIPPILSGVPTDSSWIGPDYATVKATVNDGGSPIVTKGFLYGTDSNLLVLQSGTNVQVARFYDDGNPVRLFDTTIFQLIPNRRYYVHGYASNIEGTTYGPRISFLTKPPGLPSVSTGNADSITKNQASVMGTVLSSGGSPVSQRGISVSTNPAVDSTSFKYFSGNGVGVFYVNLNGLDSCTTYFFRAFASNSVGTCYGSLNSFTTLRFPEVSTRPLSQITSNSVVTGGQILSDGGTNILARGIAYKSSPNPTIFDLNTADGNGPGSFITTVGGLQPSTLYYLRAYATNFVGTAYGNEISFTTSASLASVTTALPTGVTSIEASIGGNVVSDGGSAVTGRGIAYGLSSSPTTANFTTVNGTGTGLFVAALNGLISGMPYFARAYAINAVGVSYGNQVTFNTIAGMPQLVINTPNGVSGSGAVIVSQVVHDGSLPVTVRGVAYGVTPMPTLSNTVQVNGSGTGLYTSTLSGLISGTLFYVRAFATNAVGTGYSNQISFTTLQGYASLTTAPISNITSNSAQCGGDVLSDGGSLITSRGVAYGLTMSPNIGNNFVTTGNGLGPFVSNLTGLTGGTTYYARAFATNSIGSAYGNQVDFVTLPGVPLVTTDQPVSILANQATSGGNIMFDGGSAVISRGIAYGISSNPDLTGSFTSNGSGIGVFTSILLNLIPGTTYFNRAYATNNVGTAFGNQHTFTTLSSSPLVQTASASSITAETAISGGEVVNSGGTPVTSRGTAFALSTNPTTQNSFTTDGTGIGLFVSNLTNLRAGSLYYYRAYATNNLGTSYGAVLTFNTLPGLAMVTTGTVSAVGANSAYFVGEVLHSGGSTVTSRGFAPSTTSNPTISGPNSLQGSGTGVFAGQISGLQPGSLYFVRSFATNAIGTNYGNQTSFQTDNCGALTVNDVNGNSYPTVYIGNQCWLKANLKVMSYRNGDAIPGNLPNSTWSTTTSGAYAVYDFSPSNDSLYGKLYNGFAVNDSRGICPIGWRLPSDSDWTILVNAISPSGNSNSIVLAMNSPAFGGNNSSGFSALGSGYRESGGFYYGCGSTSNVSNKFFARSSNNGHFAISLAPFPPHLWSYQIHTAGNPNFGYAVRCIRD